MHHGLVFTDADGFLRGWIEPTDADPSVWNLHLMPGHEYPQGHGPAVQERSSRSQRLRAQCRQVIKSATPHRAHREIDMDGAEWVGGILILLVVVWGAIASDSDTPLTPRRSVFRRHAWEMVLRAEEREGVRHGRQRPNRRDDNQEPQAKWSNRR